MTHSSRSLTHIESIGLTNIFSKQSYQSGEQKLNDAQYSYR